MEYNDRPPCWDAHRVGDRIPNHDDTELDGRTCNCGKFIYKKEHCGCPGNPWKLKEYPNPDFSG